MSLSSNNFCLTQDYGGGLIVRIGDGQDCTGVPRATTLTLLCDETILYPSTMYVVDVMCCCCCHACRCVMMYVALVLKL